MSQAPLVQIREATHDVVIDMMYARPDNFTGQVIYGHTLCFLHPEAEACLRRRWRQRAALVSAQDF
jgi:D-alanyl-D-alanine dipeptidase